MYTQEFDNKIKEATKLGALSYDERSQLLKEGGILGIDTEELDVVIDGYLYLANTQTSKENFGDSVVTTTDDNGFNLLQLLKILFRNKFIGILILAILLIVFAPFILFIIAYAVSACNELFESSDKYESTANTMFSSEESEITEESTLPIFDEIVTEETTYSEETICGNFPQASERLLTEEELQAMDKLSLKYMRNEIFARHGYIFKTKEMQDYFKHQCWYLGQYDDVTSMLTDIEKENIRRIKQYENR